MKIYYNGKLYKNVHATNKVRNKLRDKRGRYDSYDRRVRIQAAKIMFFGTIIIYGFIAGAYVIGWAAGYELTVAQYKIKELIKGTEVRVWNTQAYNPDSYDPSELDVVIGPDEEVELLPELVPVCACETTGNPHAEPVHIPSQNATADVGICQINLWYQGDKAKKMGLDLFKERDNIIYANNLYTEQGLSPWIHSRHCWEGHTEGVW